MNVVTGSFNSSGASIATEVSRPRHAVRADSNRPPRDRGRTPERPSRLVVVAALLGVAVVGCLAGCAATGGSTSGAAHDTTIGTKAGAAAGVDRSDPGRVAAAFTFSMARGDYASARTLLDPTKAGVLDALATGVKGVPGTTATGTLNAGRERISGDAGTVALVGKLCREGVAPTGAPTPDCIENTDPDTVSPVFTVHVVRIDGRWYATFPTPPTTGMTSTPP